VRLVYSDRYRIDIGVHVFPTVKYQRLHQQLAPSDAFEFIEPAPPPWHELALVHTSEYLDKVRTGNLSLAELAQLELPWTPDIVEGFRLMTGGTVLAARLALENSQLRNSQLPNARGPSSGSLNSLGVAELGAGSSCGIHVGGGFHHAFANHGEGFCLFNDVAIAIRVLQREGAVARAAVVDLDVHHGNGTSMIFERDASVFTFSMHQQHNYPVFKPRSTLDIGLDDRIADAEYLSRLAGALPRVMEWRPDLVFYLAGADPYEDDRLGGLALTKEGLRRRDRLVLEVCRTAGVPVVVTLAGGYARRLEDTVDIHRATIEETGRAFES
jgi:acetoin utilization deacetylase AcuC-like enzyme